MDNPWYKQKKLEIECVDEKYYLSGIFNEYTDFSKLLTASPPLRLNLKRVFEVTSIGLRKWLEFLQQWGPKDIELYACPPSFVNVLNAVPNALGENKRKENVRSVMVPYSCAVCNQYFEVEMVMKGLQVTKRGIQMPEGECPSCGQESRLLAEPEDYFVFWTWK